MRDDGREFGRLTRPRQGQDGIGRLDHAEVAMTGFRRMDEGRGSPGRRQGGGELAPDMAGFAHAGHDHASGKPEQECHGGREPVAETRRGSAQRLFQGRDAGSLQAQRPQRRAEGTPGILAFDRVDDGVLRHGCRLYQRWQGLTRPYAEPARRAESKRAGSAARALERPSTRPRSAAGSGQDPSMSRVTSSCRWY